MKLYYLSSNKIENWNKFIFWNLFMVLPFLGLKTKYSISEEGCITNVSMATKVGKLMEMLKTKKDQGRKREKQI